MNEANNFRVCERADDLISFLYDELSEREARSFEQHRRDCRTCDSEIKSFGAVRQSILAWRDQSLGLADPHSQTKNAISAFVPENNRSALAAIRGFIALSPWWMKGATAVATVLFCALAGLAIVGLLKNPPPSVLSQAETNRRIDEEVNRRVKDQMAAFRENRVGSPVTKPEQPPTKVATVGDRQRPLHIPASQKMRKPLTRAEREQLAADLRLALDEDDDSLQLIGDRINR